jgi:hypothetical protein
MNISKKIIIALVMFAILIAGGVFFYRMFFSSQPKENAIDNKPQEQTVEENFAGMAVISNFFGTITAVSSDKKFLTVDVTSVMGTDVPDEHKTKTVMIDDKTEFVSRQYKSQEQFDKELADARTESKDGLFIAPDPLVEQKLIISDLKIGDHINFVFSSKDGESKINSDQILATQINIIP